MQSKLPRRLFLWILSDWQDDGTGGKAKGWARVAMSRHTSHMAAHMQQQPQTGADAVFSGGGPIPRLQPGLISITPLPSLPEKPTPCAPVPIREGGIRCTYRRAAPGLHSRPQLQASASASSDKEPRLEGYLHANPVTGAATLYDVDGLPIWAEFLDMRRQGVATLEEVEKPPGNRSKSELQKLSECVRYRFGDYLIVCEAPDAATAADLAAGFEARSPGAVDTSQTKKKRRITIADNAPKKKLRGISGRRQIVDEIISQSAAATSSTGVAECHRAARGVVREMMLASWDFLVGMTVHLGPKHGNARRRRADIFMALPPKKDLPDYYKIIANPVDLNRIRGRIEVGWYEPEIGAAEASSSVGSDGGSIRGSEDSSSSGSSKTPAVAVSTGHAYQTEGAAAASAAAAAAAAESTTAVAGSAATNVDKACQWGYQTWRSYEEDIVLMFQNARQYNLPESIVVRDADVMQKAFDKQSKGKQKEIQEAIQETLLRIELEKRAEQGEHCQTEQPGKEQEQETQPENSRQPEETQREEQTDQEQGEKQKQKQEQQEIEPTVDESTSMGVDVDAVQDGKSPVASVDAESDSASDDVDGSGASAAVAIAQADGDSSAVSVSSGATEPFSSAAPPLAWSVHGLVPVLLEIIDPDNSSRRFREYLTWDVNPGNRYTALECAKTICADRRLPSVMVEAIRAAIEKQCAAAIVHKPNGTAGEHVVAIRLDMELMCDVEEEEDGSELPDLNGHRVRRRQVPCHFTDQFEWDINSYALPHSGR